MHGKLPMAMKDILSISLIKLPKTSKTPISYVTPHHQMRHKSHTKVLSKWLNQSKTSK